MTIKNNIRRQRFEADTTKEEIIDFVLKSLLVVKRRRYSHGAKKGNTSVPIVVSISFPEGMKVTSKKPQDTRVKE